MVETLLSSSQVLLFGLEMDDLKIVQPVIIPDDAKRVFVATTRNVDLAAVIPSEIDGQDVKTRQNFLVWKQVRGIEDGFYKRDKVNNKFVKFFPPDETKEYVANLTMNIYVRFGEKHGKKAVTIVAKYGIDKRLAEISVNVLENRNSDHNPFSGSRNGLPSQVQQQLGYDPAFARIYGFSFEGTYYNLPRPVIFLVHGEGQPASEVKGRINRARAPGEPSLTGVGEADFQFSDEILVWSYDKADYTIRMDVETGMFEDVLLAAMLGGSGGFDSAGMNARGMNARGMNARGMNARGMNARGMNARGGGNSD